MLVQPENGMQGLHTCTCGANRSRRTTTPLSFTWRAKLMLNRARCQPRCCMQRSTKCNWQPILRSIARQSAPTDVRGPPAAVKHQPAETTKSRTSVKFQKRSSSLRVRTTPIAPASPKEQLHCAFCDDLPAVLSTCQSTAALGCSDVKA